MRLGIDAREIQNGVFTGIGRPLEDLVRFFAAECPDETCILFSSRGIPLTFGPNVRNVIMPERQTQFWDQVQLPVALRREGVDVFYSPYYKIPLAKPCPTVSAVLDLMYLTYAPYRDGMPLWRRLYYQTLGRAYVGRADRIVTCSEHAKREIMEMYEVKTEAIEVIPLSVAPGFYSETDPSKIQAMKDRYGITGRYLLYVGNFKPHKNVGILLESFACLASSYPDLQLVLAGPREHAFTELDARVKALKLNGRVIFTGKLTDSDDPHILYSAAAVFVMPSLYEGFGLPPAEAMACGVPVVASDATSIPEVVQDAGVLIDGRDSQAMAAAIQTVLDDPQKRQELLDRGKARVREFAVDAVAGRMVALLRRTAALR